VYVRSNGVQADAHANSTNCLDWIALVELPNLGLAVKYRTHRHPLKAEKGGVNSNKSSLVVGNRRAVLNNDLPLPCSFNRGGNVCQLSGPAIKILSLSLTAFKQQVLQAFKDAVVSPKRGPVRFLSLVSTGLAQAREERKGSGTRKSRTTVLTDRAKKSAAEAAACREEVDNVLLSLPIDSLKLVAISLGLDVQGGATNLADVLAAVKSGCVSRTNKRKAELLTEDHDDDDDEGPDEGGHGD
jgi:hypothetical protein